jgi:uncharacterized membrane protein
MALALLIFSFAVLCMLTVFSFRMRRFAGEQAGGDSNEKSNLIQNWIYAAIVLSIVAMVSAVYFLVKDGPYEGHVLEWLNILLRVMHITFGIAWIGASFYFVFLENALNRKDNIREELAGDLWAVHGGGFYYLEKYKVAPKAMPRHLHWFKYEAYFTWLSGIGLLFILYYFNASGMLVDREVMVLKPGIAILISLLSLVVGWWIYDLLCKSPVARNPYLFTILIILLLGAFAYGYSQVFGGRAAFIHFGALLGTWMAANVFFVIIPSQKAMVNAAKKGEIPDAGKGKNALFRSIQNNYFTLPVLFVMVSNHFPSTFSHSAQWVVLIIISLATAGIKHWLNLREKGQFSVWILPVSILVLMVAAYITRPVVATTKCEPVSFAAINSIFQDRCVSCHSSRPSDDVFTAPPNGVVYDTPADIIKKLDLIMQRVVVTKTMPQNNKTNMTPEERELIRCWIEQGASVK